MGQAEILDLLDMLPIWWTVKELKEVFPNSSLNMHRLVRKLVKYDCAVEYIGFKEKKYIRSSKWDGLGEKIPTDYLIGELL